MKTKLDTKPFRPKWRCFSCGRVMKSRKALNGHLNFCYWYQKVFKHRIEEAPFYVETPSRQLRYYNRNRDKVNAQRRNHYKETTTRTITVKTRTTPLRIPSTLRRR